MESSGTKVDFVTSSSVSNPDPASGFGLYPRPTVSRSEFLFRLGLGLRILNCSVHSERTSKAKSLPNYFTGQNRPPKVGVNIGIKSQLSLTAHGCVLHTTTPRETLINIQVMEDEKHDRNDSIQAHSYSCKQRIGRNLLELQKTEQISRISF